MNEHYTGRCTCQTPGFAIVTASPLLITGLPQQTPMRSV